ncbi:MAG: bifunctional riboflavin kinase/FAD synthetase [Labrys sp. (in: a-proteobacteria)]|jgi:riboflavin kinase/FMN adenylyltransferase
MPFTSLLDPDTIPAPLAGAAVAIGNFDGVHRGHRAVIDAARRLAADLGGPALALTFEPHPRKVFRPEVPLFRLSPPAVKATLFERAGLDGAVTLSFDRLFAETSAERFLADLLVGRLKARAVAIGHDFSFGKGRQGNADFILARAPALGLKVAVVPAFAQDGAAVSSSAIRAALAAGDVRRANALLGHEWFVRGTVVHGEKIGRTLGYPTANMAFDPDFALADGIYAVRATIDGVVRPGVASYGRRPTFGDGAPLLETYVFDFTGDLYGKEIDITFVDYIRGQIKFDGVEALIERMHEDSRIARAITGG